MQNALFACSLILSVCLFAVGFYLLARRAFNILYLVLSRRKNTRVKLSQANIRLPSAFYKIPLRKRLWSSRIILKFSRRDLRGQGKHHRKKLLNRISVVFLLFRVICRGIFPRIRKTIVKWFLVISNTLPYKVKILSKVCFLRLELFVGFSVVLISFALVRVVWVWGSKWI